MNKNELKQHMVSILTEKSSKSWFIRDHQARIETICRAAINRLSYELVCNYGGKPSIALVREGKVIFIEENPNADIGSGYGCPLHETVFQKVVEILDELKKQCPRPEVSVAQ